MDDDLLIRPARRKDLPNIVAMFADDELGGHGDTTDPAAAGDYLRAFEAIEASPNDVLYVAELQGEVAGTLQTTLITSLSGRGATTMRIEAVQTRSDLRGRGIGAAMIRFAIEKGREAGARHVHLTSNMARLDAHRFYERLGFSKSHFGFKMKLR
jgi:GNAT superfamily N-acetyltransferase